MERIEIRVSYDAGNWPEWDDAVQNAAGRPSDFSGMGFGQRDHGWVCDNELDAKRIEWGLAKIGLTPATRHVPEPPQ